MPPKEVYVFFEWRNSCRNTPAGNIVANFLESIIPAQGTRPVGNCSRSLVIVPLSVHFDIGGVIGEAFVKVSFGQVSPHQYRQGHQRRALVAFTEEIPIFGSIKIAFNSKGFQDLGFCLFLRIRDRQGFFYCKINRAFIGHVRKQIHVCLISFGEVGQRIQCHRALGFFARNFVSVETIRLEEDVRRNKLCHLQRKFALVVLDFALVAITRLCKRFFIEFPHGHAGTVYERALLRNARNSFVYDNSNFMIVFADNGFVILFGITRVFGLIAASHQKENSAHKRRKGYFLLFHRTLLFWEYIFSFFSPTSVSEKNRKLGRISQNLAINHNILHLF